MGFILNMKYVNKNYKISTMVFTIITIQYRDNFNDILHSKQRNNSHIDETGKFDPDIYLFIYLLEHMVIQSSR